VRNDWKITRMANKKWKWSTQTHACIRAGMRTWFLQQSLNDGYCFDSISSFI
jgi:hypothetical protein